MANETHDRDVEQYRSLLETPKTFQDGFGWTTVLGIIFCGLVMMPGGIYLGLMTGYGIGSAASWVTVILFMEIARRAMKPLSKENLVVLLHAAQVMMAGNLLFPGGPLGQLVFRAYFAGSQAVRDAGLLGAFPDWFVPPADSPAVLERTFWHQDWIIPIGILFFVTAIGLLKRYTLGYIFFRLTSDVERLPFPLAPINAQGAMALAEADEKTDDPLAPADHPGPAPNQKGQRWRIFSLGAYIGIAFGFIQVGIPAITGILFARPFYLIPQPFIDTTTLTEGFLPATPTGITFDLGVVFLGFILPFWSVIGTFIAILLTLLLNPLLFQLEILQTWQPGMDTVNTTFANRFDFWLSFSIGSGVGIAAVCLFATARDLLGKARELRAARARGELPTSVWAPPCDGRGDYPLWIAIALYLAVSVALIILCWLLLPRTANILFFLIFFSFIYTPFISYVNARLLGISGQNVEIPYVKESAFLLSGAKGVEIWLAPVPIDNYGYQAQSFRVNELTGVSFWSLVKTDLVAVPVLFLLSLLFWGFIWKSDPIPSDIFPAAQIHWELAAKDNALIFSSTFAAPGEDPDTKSFEQSQLARALKAPVIGGSFLFIVAAYGLLSLFGLPIMLVYGMIRGFGQLPHTMVLEVVGALIARFYLHKKYGTKNFLLMAPTLFAGYLTGVGLIGMATIALRLIKSAVSASPF